VKKIGIGYFYLDSKLRDSNGNARMRAEHRISKLLFPLAGSSKNGRVTVYQCYLITLKNITVHYEV